MELINTFDISGLVRFYFHCALLFCHVSIPSCAGQDSREIAQEDGPFCSESSGCNLDNLHSFAVSKTGKIDIDTGIPFILENLQPALASVLAKNSRNQSGPKERVQKFIRAVKGSLSLQNQEGQGQYVIGSGQNASLKPAWCFHPYLLKNLVQVELKMYKILRKFYLNNRHGTAPLMTALESYLTDVEQSSLKAIRNIEAANQGQSSPEDPNLYIASHPLLIYKLVRRFAEDIQPILLEIEHQYDGDLIISMSEEANPDLLVFPTKDDLNNALESINRMQNGNLLNTFDMARGVLDHVDTGIYMNALDSLELGAFYLEADTYDLAIQWLHFAHETVKRSSVTQVSPEIQVFFQSMLEEGVELHNTKFPLMFDHKWGSGLFNSTVTLPFEPTAYTSQLDQLKQLASEERNVTYWNWAIKQNFKRVCTGENLQTAEETAVLKCWYHSNHYYWLINPLKTELLNMNPPVFQFYDFLGEKLIEKIKSSAVSQLERSKVVDRSSATDSKVDPSRTSTQTWLYDGSENTKFLDLLSKQMEFLSGLIILPKSSSDAYQVASYGPSHHYDTHIDSFGDPRRCEEKGNRITTIMGYLSDVTVGGRTGFPVLGTSAAPVKGSIVMWNNLKRNAEERDMRTWHGGCPVVLGIKWITNKWVYSKDNAFTFQCPLDKDE